MIESSVGKLVKGTMKDGQEILGILLRDEERYSILLPHGLAVYIESFIEIPADLSKKLDELGE
jgi:hypothetical protein